MARREQHARHREHIRDTLIGQLAEPVLDHRGREFEKSVFDGYIARPCADRDGQFFKLRNRAFIAAAMAANHDSCGQLSLLFRWQLIPDACRAIVAG